MWSDLVGRIQKGSNLEKEVIECLMKLYGGQFYRESALKGTLPTHIAAIFGYINIFMFVASYLGMSMLLELMDGLHFILLLGMEALTFSNSWHLK